MLAKKFVRMDDKKEVIAMTRWNPEPTIDLLLEFRRRGLGIDLGKRFGEVRKLLLAGYGDRLARSGWDVEDVLQDVYLGLLTRNRGTCPWDPEKSSFGHYVHMVCGCIVSNYGRKVNRVRDREHIGMTDMDGLEVDAAEFAESPEMVSVETEIRDYLDKYLGGADRDVFEGLVQGEGRGSLRHRVGLDVRDYDASVAEVHRVVKEYFLGQ